MTTEFKVRLACVEGGSSKFWRGRIEGSTLFVNYGRIGTGGQTQVKQMGTAEAAEKELAKLEREKRKKGYVDEDAAGAAGAQEEEDEGGDEEGEGDEEEAAPAPKPAAPPVSAKPAPAAAPAAVAQNLAIDRPDRKVELRLVQDGASVRMVAVERYPNAEEAKKAMERLKAAFEAEGYRPAPAREI
ncbi:MAG: WGR domain-containing protein [Myxococcales bacterium]